jgi:uncharacterized repeat protein (TIGR01451 family)
MRTIHAGCRLSLIVAVGASLVVVAPGVASATGGPVTPTNGGAPPGLSPFTVNNGPGNYAPVRIDGSLVVYDEQADVDGQSYIHYHDLTSGADGLVPLGPDGEDADPDVSGTTIVYIHATAADQSIDSFDTADPTAAPLELAPDPSVARNSPVIAANTVAWTESGATSATFPQVVAYNRATGATDDLTDDAYWNTNPELSPNGAVIVWTQCTTSYNTGCAVYESTLEGSSWSEPPLQLTIPSLGDADDPSTNGQVVVYDSTRGGQQDIYWQPVGGGGVESQLVLPGASEDPQISGHLITFAHQAAPGQAFGVDAYDLDTNTLYQVSGGVYDDEIPDVSVDDTGLARVVWITAEPKPGGAGYGFSAYGASFNVTTVAPTTTTLTVSPPSPALNQPVSYTAIVAPLSPAAIGTPTGSVAFSDGGTTIAGCGSVALTTVGLGSQQASCITSYTLPSFHFVTAAYGGSSSFGPSSGQVSLNVAAVPPSFGGNPPEATVGVPYDFSFSVVGVPPPTLLVTLGSLPPGLSMSVGGHVTGTPTTTGLYFFTVAATNDIPPNFSRNLAIGVEAPAADLSISLSGPKTAQEGATVTYTAEVTNTGPGAASDVLATIHLPKGLDVVSTTSGAILSGNLINWAEASLPPGGQLSFQVTGTASVAIGGLLLVSGSTFSAWPDPTPFDNFAFTTTRVVLPPAPRAPAVTSLSPSSGPVEGGTAVTITGSGFTGATAVSFGTKPAASLSVVSDSEITTTSPLGTGAGALDVTVTTPGGTSATSPADQFTYAAGNPPQVTGVTPVEINTSGGTVITISGSGFTGTTEVRLDTTEYEIPVETFTVVNDDTIQATTPPTPSSDELRIDVRVITPGGISPVTSADEVVYNF